MKAEFAEQGIVKLIPRDVTVRLEVFLKDDSFALQRIVSVTLCSTHSGPPQCRGEQQEERPRPLFEPPWRRFGTNLLHQGLEADPNI